MKHVLLLLLAPIAFAACSSAPLEEPKAQELNLPLRHGSREPTAEFRSVFEVVQRIRKDVDQTTPDLCDRLWLGNFNRLLQSKSDRIDASELKAKGELIIQQIFETRLAVREKLKSWYKQGTSIPRSCVGDARALLRGLRFLEEYVAEFNAKPVLVNQRWPQVSFMRGEFPYTMINPDAKYRNFDLETGLQSGDALMSRGAAFTSAAIARMGDVDGQFSHLAFLYIDPDTHQKYVTEAHIEIGVKVRPFEEYLKDGNLRVVVYRNWQMPELAHRAAKAMYERALHASETTGNIPYNFSMDLSKTDQLMCTQVIHQGYLDASNGSYPVPLFMSKITPRNRDFFDRLGIEVHESFLPIDMEVDPRFDVVMEWRNLSKANDLRLFDAMLTQFFRWSEDPEKDYVLQKHWLFRPLAKFLVRSRHWPIFSDLLKGQFPENMSPKILETIAAMNKVSKALYKVLDQQNKAHIKENGLPMSMIEMYRVLEDFREKDYQDHLKFQAWMKERWDGKRKRDAPRGSKFHSYFRPREKQNSSVHDAIQKEEQRRAEERE